MSLVRPSLQELIDELEPAWDQVRLLSRPGEVSEAEYLALDTNRLIEFTDGCLEELPMPTTAHQLVARLLFQKLDAFVTSRRLGLVLFAPLRIRISTGRYREPDMVFMRAENIHRARDDYWDGADLVVEIVSAGGRHRDLVKKRGEYADAGIPEYWIVDREQERILVLTLEGDAYREHGDFRRGDEAMSPTLSGFTVAVNDVLDAAS